VNWGLHNAAGFGTLVKPAKVRPWLMGWLRKNRGGVAWLAFFALACQLILSFGHVHLGKANGGLAALAAVADSSSPSNAAPTAPRHQKPPSVPDDFCAICANIGLAGALVVPASPVVFAPDSFISVLPWSLAANESASFDRLLFEARGPPHA
jgi:hypothetical protein